MKQEDECVYLGVTNLCGSFYFPNLRSTLRKGFTSLNSLFLVNELKVLGNASLIQCAHHTVENTTEECLLFLTGYSIEGLYSLAAEI